MTESLCDICGVRPATGGNIRRIDGVDKRTSYCEICAPTVPIGHTAWVTVTAQPREWRRELVVRATIIAAGAALTIVAAWYLWR
jgi:hypothetical protein